MPGPEHYAVGLTGKIEDTKNTSRLLKISPVACRPGCLVADDEVEHDGNHDGEDVGIAEIGVGGAACFIDHGETAAPEVGAVRVVAAAIELTRIAPMATAARRSGVHIECHPHSVSRRLWYPVV